MSMRAERAVRILFWRAVAAGATDRAIEERDQLQAEAMAEFEIHKSATTWRMEQATVPLYVTKPRVVVSDRDAWLQWVAKRYPSEIEESVQVRPSFEARALRELSDAGDPPCTDDGEIIPGLTHIPGGQPKGITVRPTPGVAERMAAMAEIALGRMEEAS